MCLICSDLSKDKIKVKDARRNLQEMKDSVTREHYAEILELIDDKEKDDYFLQGSFNTD